MSDPTPATVVIGLGSPLMGDDGVGLAALAMLRERWLLPAEVALIDGGTWGMNLLPVLEDAERVILLDAIRGGGPPGAVVELEGAAVPRVLHHKLSPHQIDIADVLAVAALRGTLPGDLAAVGVEPLEVEMRTSLSAVVQAALPAMVDRVISRLEALGICCEPREWGVACTS